MSIKYKLLLVLITIPLLIVAAYVYLIVQIYSKNQTAYVLDSISSLGKTSSTQLNSKIGDYLSSLELISSGYNPINNSFAEISTTVFKKERGVSQIHVGILDANGTLNLKKSESKVSNNLKKKEDLLRNELAKMSADIVPGEMGVISSKTERSSLWITMNSSFDDGGNKKRIVFFALCSVKDSMDMFRSSSIYQNFLYNIKKNQVVLGASKYDFSKWSFYIGLKKNPRIKQVISVKSDDASDYFASIVPVLIKDHAIVTIVDKKTVFASITEFIFTSIYFMVVAVSLLLIIGIIASSRITKSLIKLTAATQKIAKGDFAINLERKSSDEVGILTENFNNMSQKILKLLNDVVGKARMEEELKTARIVQKTLIPKLTRLIENYEISGHFSPANECSGDWWYYNVIGDKIYVWIGDATGHGVPPALMTSAALSASGIIMSMKNMTPAKALTLLNRSFSRMSGDIMYMTFFVGIIDRNTGVLSYANASHEPPLIFRKVDDKYSKKNILVLNEVNGPRLRSQKKPKYEESSVQLEKDDLLLMFTDGIYDVVNNSGERYGEGKFVRSVVKSCNENETLKNVTNDIVVKLNEFREDTPLDDDVTFFFLKHFV